MATSSSLLVYSYNNNTLLLKIIEEQHHESLSTTNKNNTKKEIGLALLQNNNHPVLGNIYYGKIIKYQKSLDCYFLDIGNNQYALLKNTRQTKTLLNNPTYGQKILVIITKEGNEEKHPTASVNFIFNGLFTSFIPLSNTPISFSSNVNENIRAEITKIISATFPNTTGIKIKNTNNINYLTREIALKQTFWEQLCKNNLTKPGLVFSPSIVLNAIFADNLNLPNKIIVNSISLLEKIKSDLNTFVPFLNIELLYNNSANTYIEHLPMLEENLCNRQNINNEIILNIYNTKALTFIDIDFKADSSLNKEDALFKANIDTIPYITKLIKFQNISGQIFIDTLKVKNKELQNLLLQQYKVAFSNNNLQATILGFTKLGVLEVERPKTNNSISNQFFNSCNFCNGNGKIISNNFLNLKTILQIKQIVEKNPLATITLKTSSHNLEQFKNSNSTIVNNLQNNNKINFIIDENISNNILVY